MARVFISYNRKDEDFARKLARSLSELGEDIWIDVEDIPAGMNWSSAIQQGLLVCDVMLVIISPDSMVSSNVADEWQYYRDQRKPIIPVLWKPADVHYQLKRIQYIDFQNQDYDAALKQLHNAIENRGVPQVATLHTPPLVPEQSPKERRLEAAMPQQTKMDTSTEVWLKVTLTESEGLRGELPAVVASGDVIQKGDVRGSTFPITFPVDSQTGRLLPINVCVKVTSRAFRVRAETDPGGECDEGQVNLELQPDYDSRTVVFELVAAPQQEASRARVTISLYHEDRLVAQTAISTEIVEAVQQSAGAKTWNLLATPLFLAAAPAQGFYMPGDTTLVGEQTLPLPPSSMVEAARAKARSPVWISGATLVALVLLGGLLLFRWVNAPMVNAQATATAMAFVEATGGETPPSATPMATETHAATGTPAATLTAHEHYEQGRSYYESQDYDEAIAEFTRATHLDSNDANPHWGLGDVYYALERFDDALASYRRYLELETHDPAKFVIDRVQELETRLIATPG